MKAGFFDPYLDTVGGGEKYTLTLVEYLLKNGWDVDLFWNNLGLKKKLELRFNLNLDRVNFVNIPKNVLKRWRITRNYDLFFWLSDGSIPWLFSKKNILHFQVPFQKVNGRSPVNRLKFKRTHHIVCNSKFTKRFIDREFGVQSEVIYPPVDIEKFRPDKKENIVLSVGRFSQLLQAKRQDVLIEVFRQMVDQGLAGWKLVLAGGSEVGADKYLQKLRAMVNSYPVEILENLEFNKIRDLYGKAKIFWNAAGFGIDEKKEPEKAEHFGIVVVEAMASGCVPVAIGKGGVREIIKEGETGFFWETKEGLVKKTLELIKSPKLVQKISQEVLKSSQDFSKQRFCQEFTRLL